MVPVKTFLVHARFYRAKNSVPEKIPKYLSVRHAKKGGPWAGSIAEKTDQM
jgi:hypothetical protein